VNTTMVGLMIKARCKSLDTTIFFDIPPNTSPTARRTFHVYVALQKYLVNDSTARWGQIQKIPKNAEEMAQTGWRTDLIVRLAEMG